MKFRFWGVRGSIPSPGPRTARYGGNTTCIEVRTDDDTLIVLDGGTGLFPLAQHLLGEVLQRQVEGRVDGQVLGGEVLLRVALREVVGGVLRIHVRDERDAQR